MNVYRWQARSRAVAVYEGRRQQSPGGIKWNRNDADDAGGGGGGGDDDGDGDGDGDDTSKMIILGRPQLQRSLCGGGAYRAPVAATWAAVDGSYDL